LHASGRSGRDRQVIVAISTVHDQVSFLLGNRLDTRPRYSLAVTARCRQHSARPAIKVPVPLARCHDGNWPCRAPRKPDKCRLPPGRRCDRRWPTLAETRSTSSPCASHRPSSSLNPGITDRRRCPITVVPSPSHVGERSYRRAITLSRPRLAGVAHPHRSGPAPQGRRRYRFRAWPSA